MSSCGALELACISGQTSCRELILSFILTISRRERECFLKLSYFSFPMVYKGAEIWGKEANILANVVKQSFFVDKLR